MGRDDFDDDYVANLLKQDAQKTAKQYQMVGLDAFAPSRPRSGAPKPNMRFLRHIIRETDSHNSALLAKEAEESRARLRRMQKEGNVKARDPGRLTPPDLSEDEHRHGKRKRPDYDDDRDERQERRTRERTFREEEGDRSRKERDRESRRHRNRSRHRSSGEDDRRDRSHPSRRDRDKAHHHRDDERSRRHRHRGEDSHRKHSSRRSRSRSSERSASPARRHHKSSRHHNRSRSRSTSRHRHASRDRGRKTDSPKRSRRAQEPDSDSDPLEAIVGPLPPPPVPVVRARGRGAHKANSMGMDGRFSSTYDPTVDVHLNSDVEDDWGDALEALRDRQRWKQQGAERLKAAGFSDEQVKKWEKGDDKTEDDVRWARKGEGREWDRGKVLDDDGDVALKAEWGRLT